MAAQQNNTSPFTFTSYSSLLLIAPMTSIREAVWKMMDAPLHTFFSRSLSLISPSNVLSFVSPWQPNIKPQILNTLQIILECPDVCFRKYFIQKNILKKLQAHVIYLVKLVLLSKTLHAVITAENSNENKRHDMGLTVN